MFRLFWRVQYKANILYLKYKSILLLVFYIERINNFKSMVVTG